MGELVSIKKVLSSAVTSETPLTVVEKREPKPCEQCGVPQEPIHIASLEMWIDRSPVCEKCRGGNEEAAKVAAEKYRRENIEPELLKCGVPAQFVKYTFNGNANGPIRWGSVKPIVEQAYAFALRPEGGLLLSGKTGRGKTHIAVAILRESVIRGRKGRFVSCLDLMNALRSVYKARDDDDDSEQDVINSVGRGIVILDDMGATRVTPLMKDAMTLIVDRCERRGQPLVVTTNLTIAEIGERIDERLASRLVGLCKSHDRVITLRGEDHRLKFKK